MPKKFAEVNSKAAAGRERKAAAAGEKKAKQAALKAAEEDKKWEEGTKKKSAKKEHDEAKKQEKLQLKAEKQKLLEAEEKQFAGHRPLKPLKEEKHHKPTIPEFSASNLDDAIFLLHVDDSKAQASATLERHPERRVKAAYAAYKQKMLPILKEENPSLRLTQLEEILYKQWQKSPDNPFNQMHISYETSRDEERKLLQEQTQNTLARLTINKK